MKRLKPQHKLFADIYRAERNATLAAIRAGFSEKAAKVQGCKLLKHPLVAAYIAEQDKVIVTNVKKSVSGSLAWKRKKLIKIVKELSIAIDAKTAKPVIGAIAELNKMDGHYSAEKVINTNLNVDTDLEQVAIASRNAEEMLAKHRREF